MELLLTLLLLSFCKKSTGSKCNRLKIGDKFYEREALLNNVGRPYNLNVHRPTNTLFFTYSTPDMFSDVDFQLAHYSLDTKELQIVAGIKGGCSVAIDTDADEIYLGGTDGIYKFDMLTNIADFYKEKGQNIWSLFHRKNLFYISYPDQKLHLEIGEKFYVVKEFADFQTDSFFVTKTSDILFSNQSGLFQFDTNNMTIHILNDVLTVRQFVEDHDSNLFICTNFGVYTFSKEVGLKRVIDDRNIFGLTLDRDNNFIISETQSLWKLVPRDKGCDSKPF